MANIKKKPRSLNDPIRIERRMKLAHFFGLAELEEELWAQLQEVKTNDARTQEISC